MTQDSSGNPSLKTVNVPVLDRKAIIYDPPQTLLSTHYVTACTMATSTFALLLAAFYALQNPQDGGAPFCSSTLPPWHERSMITAHTISFGCTICSTLINIFNLFGEKGALQDNVDYKKNVNSVVMTIITINGILGMSQGLSFFHLNGAEKSYCIDAFGFKSPLIQWAEWQISVPLMMYLIITLDTRKTQFSFEDYAIIILSYLCILLAFSLNWNIVARGHGIILALSSICMFASILMLVASSRRKYNNAIHSSIDYSDRRLFKALEMHIAMTSYYSSLFIALSFTLFPLVYYLAIFKICAPDVITIVIQYLNFVVKICFSVILFRGHMSILDPNTYDLEIQRRCNDARTTLLRYVFHEVRVPLNSISLGLHIIKNQIKQLNGGGNAESDEVIFMMQEAVTMMTQTLNDVLSLQRIEQGRMQLSLVPTNLTSTVNSALVTLQPLITSKRIKTKVVFESTVPKCVNADVHRIMHVVTNLLSNALKFSPNGSTIILSVKSDVKSPHVVTISVEDEGVGLSADEIDVIFKPYTQVRPGELQQGRGSGIGLAICKEIVELHNGTISVKSTIGKGSNFFFTIPYEVLNGPMTELSTTLLNDVSKDVNNAASSKADVMVAEDIKVLVVDDVLSNRKMLSTLLKMFHLHVEMVGDGVEAVEHVEKVGIDHYNLILMDNVMPKMMGTECASVLREMGYKNLLIGVTGNALDEDVSIFTSCGADAVLSKPVKKTQLDRLINHIKKFGCGSKREDAKIFLDTGVTSRAYVDFLAIKGEDDSEHRMHL